MKEIIIEIELDKKQIVNDVALECNQLGRTMGHQSGLEELAADIMTPDDNETKPIVARSLTEAIDIVKSTCHRYLTMGRLKDDNRRETILGATKEEQTAESGVPCEFSMGIKKGRKYEITQGATGYASATVSLKTSEGKQTLLGELGGKTQSLTFYAESDGVIIVQHTGEVDAVYTLSDKTASIFRLQLEMPSSFNPGMTSAIKSASHRIMVDYVMAQVLKNQQVEKYQTYMQLVEADRSMLRSALRTRSVYRRRAADWS